MGLDEPEENATNTYERNMKIVPDCIKTNDNEVPIKQYDLAVLQTKLKFMRAEGRLQVTNQRLIFRATGRSIRGRTTIQHHFNLNDIAGIEARKDYRFAALNLILGILAFLGIALLCNIFVSSLYENAVAFAVILGIAGLVPFFIIKRMFLAKLLCCAVSFGSLMGGSSVGTVLVGGLGGLGGYGGYGGYGGSGLNVGVLILAIISSIISFVALLLFAFKPNLVFTVKTKGGGSVMEIRRKAKKEEYTGYEDVLPWKDTEKAIREVGAMIHDIQTLGKHGVDKWLGKTPPNATTASNDDDD